MYPVEDRPDLMKDPSTGAVINTNSHALKQAKLAKQRVLAEKVRADDMEKRLNRLEQTVSELYMKESARGVYGK